MIDETDRQLIDWIGGKLHQTKVSLAPPAETETTEGVGLYLMELVHSQPARTARRPPLLMTLRYLVTTHAAKPEDAHQMLEDLLVDAFEKQKFEVEQEPLPLAVWSALGIAPRPAFVLRMPFKYEPEEKLAQRVKTSMVVQQVPLRSFSGQIVGPEPEKIPLMNVRVELPRLELSTNTDSKGKFSFSAVPAMPGPRLLRVLAKGQEFLINTEHDGSDRDPLVIPLKLEG
jgi:hypothetical protein